MSQSHSLTKASSQSGVGTKCYYWVCASIMMDADDRADPRAVQRVYAALSCAQADGCIRAGDCRDLTLAALGRLLEARPRD